MSSRANRDQLLAIWALKTLGWSFRRIARLILPSSHHTVSHYYKQGYKMIKSGELPIFTKGEKALKITPFGNIEYLEGKIHHNPCGGGKRIKPHIYDDEWKDISER